jgi:hypothetical protein
MQRHIFFSFKIIEHLVRQIMMVFTSLATHLGSTLWNYSPSSFPWQPTLKGLTDNQALRAMIMEYSRDADGTQEGLLNDFDYLPMTQSLHAGYVAWAPT